MSSKTVKMMSYVAMFNKNTPSFPMSEGSIIIIDENGSEFLVGDDAPAFSPDSGRITGGSLKDAHYCRLLKALVAKGLGGGEFTISVGMSAAANQIQKFREHRGATTLNEADFVKLQDVVKSIKFRVGRSDAPIQTCEVKLKAVPVPVFYETEAVAKVMPDYAKTMMLFQVGGGDWQSLIVIDGDVQQQTHTRAVGLNAAIEQLGKDLGLSKKEALRAWMTNTKPSDGLRGEPVDCVSEKSSAIRQHISINLSKIIASTEGFQDRLQAVVVSGGAVHDELFLNVLKEELPSDYTMYSVSDMELMEPNGKKLMDPSFTCAFGIKSTGCDVALDIGNNYLKGIFDYA